MIKYIYGLDQSLCAFGVSIFNLKGKPIEVFEFNSKNKGDKRLLEIENMLYNYYKKYPPVFVCKEAYAYGRAQRACGMGELGWAVRRGLYINNIPYCEVSPQTLKKFVTGHGRGDKTKTKGIIIREVYRKWNCIANTDNEADAFGLGMLGLHIYKQVFADKDICRYEYERACIKSILTSKKKGIVYGQAQEEIKRKAKRNNKKVKKQKRSS